MLIKIKVFPNSKKEGIVKKGKDSFEIKIKEKPERDQANKRIKKVLAGYFNLPENKVRIIKGRHQRRKLLEIAAGDPPHKI